MKTLLLEETRTTMMKTHCQVQEISLQIQLYLSFSWVAESFDVSAAVGDVDEEGFASGGFAVAVAAEPAKNCLIVNQGIHITIESK